MHVSEGPRPGIFRFRRGHGAPEGPGVTPSLHVVGFRHLSLQVGLQALTMDRDAGTSGVPARSCPRELLKSSARASRSWTHPCVLKPAIRLYPRFTSKNTWPTRPSLPKDSNTSCRYWSHFRSYRSSTSTFAKKHRVTWHQQSLTSS